MPLQELENLRYDPAALARLKPIAEQLGILYRNMGRNLTLRELVIEIERRFGPQIVDLICVPYELTESACLWIAAKVAEEEARTIV